MRFAKYICTLLICMSATTLHEIRNSSHMLHHFFVLTLMWFYSKADKSGAHIMFLLDIHYHDEKQCMYAKCTLCAVNFPRIAIYFSRFLLPRCETKLDLPKPILHYFALLIHLHSGKKCVLYYDIFHLFSNE